MAAMNYYNSLILVKGGADNKYLGEVIWRGHGKVSGDCGTTKLSTSVLSGCPP
jgi:hypothetical protein